jgi:hypothetical protein
MILFDAFLNFAKLRPAESAAPAQPDRLQPKLCGPFVALNVCMSRFIFVACIEEKSVRTDSEYRWHASSLKSFLHKQHRALAIIISISRR